MLSYKEEDGEEDLLQEIVTFIKNNRDRTQKLLYCSGVDQKTQRMAEDVHAITKCATLRLDDYVPLFWAFACSGHHSPIPDVSSGMHATSEIAADDRRDCVRCVFEKTIEGAVFLFCSYAQLFSAELHNFLSNTHFSVTCFFDDGLFFDAVCRRSISLTRKNLENGLEYTKSLLSIVGKSDTAKETERNRKGVFAYKKHVPFPGSFRNPKHFLGVLRRIVSTLSVFLGNKSYGEDFLASLTDNAQVSLEEITATQNRLLLLERTSLSAKSAEIEHRHTVFQCSLYKTLQFAITAATCPEKETFHVSVGSELSLLVLDHLPAQKRLCSVFKKFILVGSKMRINKSLLLLHQTKTKHVGRTHTQNSQKASPQVLIVTRGNDQVSMGLEDGTLKENVIGNYGRLLVDLTRAVPEGILCYFPDILQIRAALSVWKKTGLLEEMLENKILFAEDGSLGETLFYHCEACDRGRGSVLLLTMDSGVERTELRGPHKRAVVVFGNEQTTSHCKKEFLQAIQENTGLAEETYREFSLVQKTSWCIGNLPRGCQTILLVGREYRTRLQSQENWLLDFLSEENSDLSIDAAIHKIVYRK
ncbi:MAG: TFIIH basal transcription factor complex helicase XPD [Amphiamblys sp. WSBS2006]|nr:MAG: TFIIH basal transcription factor complex helicase XPD [Amphiamblys sp. WSBS2006]